MADSLGAQPRCEIDLDDEGEDVEHDRSGARRNLWLRQFEVELSASGLRELEDGGISPLDLWELPRGDHRLQFHPQYDGDDDDSDVEEGPRHASSGIDGPSGEGDEAIGQGGMQEDDDFLEVSIGE